MRAVHPSLIVERIVAAGQSILAFAALAAVSCSSGQEPSNAAAKPDLIVQQQAAPIPVQTSAPPPQSASNVGSDNIHQPASDVVKAASTTARTPPDPDEAARSQRARMQHQVYLCKRDCGQQASQCRMGCGKAGARSGSRFNTSQCSMQCTKTGVACERRCGGYAT
jgi:hypothetical protein